MLQRLGYAVVVAGDGRAGLECVRERPAAIGLVLLDLTMPGLSGFETLRRLQELNPRLPVVICSGYGTTGPASGETLRSAGAIAVLAKPFELTELSSLLRRTTGRDA
jgi:CheY-like chemotaxis protein